MKVLFRFLIGMAVLSQGFFLHAMNQDPEAGSSQSIKRRKSPFETDSSSSSSSGESGVSLQLLLQVPKRRKGPNGSFPGSRSATSLSKLEREALSQRPRSWGRQNSLKHKNLGSSPLRFGADSSQSSTVPLLGENSDEDLESLTETPSKWSRLLNCCFPKRIRNEVYEHRGPLLILGGGIILCIGGYYMWESGATLQDTCLAMKEACDIAQKTCLECGKQLKDTLEELKYWKQEYNWLKNNATVRLQQCLDSAAKCNNTSSSSVTPLAFFLGQPQAPVNPAAQAEQQLPPMPGGLPFPEE